MGSLSIWHWLIVLVIVLLLFGTKKLKNLGQDLGSAVKGFKDGIKEEQPGSSAAQIAGTPSSNPTSGNGAGRNETIDVEAKSRS